MYVSSIGSRFLLGVKLLLGFTRLGSSVMGLSVKNSFNLNLRQNVLMSAFNSVVFVLGTGVNFRPLFTSMFIMVLLKLLLDRFTTRGMLPLLVCRFFLANLGLCLAVGRRAKKNHFVTVQSRFKVSPIRFPVCCISEVSVVRFLSFRFPACCISEVSVVRPFPFRFPACASEIRIS